MKGRAVKLVFFNYRNKRGASGLEKTESRLVQLLHHFSSLGPFSLVAELIFRESSRNKLSSWQLPNTLVAKPMRPWISDTSVPHPWKITHLHLAGRAQPSEFTQGTLEVIYSWVLPTHRFSYRQHAQVLDVELLYQFCLWCWEIYCMGTKINFCLSAFTAGKATSISSIAWNSLPSNCTLKVPYWLKPIFTTSDHNNAQ